MNKNVRTAVIGLTVVIVFAYFYFQISVRENVTGENQYRLANSYIKDGKYDKALEILDEVLKEEPDYEYAHLGRALTLMQMQRFDESMAAFDTAIGLDENLAAAYANRGILNDRMGRYEAAVLDYRKATELDAELSEGPGLIWRFLHNVTKTPATLMDRADYIEEELKKPEEERLLRLPEMDAEQRMYKK